MMRPEQREIRRTVMFMRAISGGSGALSSPGASFTNVPLMVGENYSKML